ncbi:MAG: hypothetical protein Q9160_001162 [Pyrenula sp. 1 TL-2023]
MWRTISALPARIQSSTFEQLTRLKYQPESCGQLSSKGYLGQDVFQVLTYRKRIHSSAFTTKTGSCISTAHESMEDLETHIKHLDRLEPYAVAKSKKLTDIFNDWVQTRFRRPTAEDHDTKVENEILPAYLERGHEEQSETDLVDGISVAPQILVSHIVKIADLGLQDSHLNVLLLQVYTDKVCLLLAQDGYSIQDVTTWAWILTSQNADEAIGKLVLLTTRRKITIPSFLLQFILSRQTISPQNLKFLVDQIKTSLKSPANHVDYEDDGTSLRFRIDSQNPTSMMLLFVRLARHCRRVWVRGLCDIADLLALMFPAKPLQLRWESNINIERFQRLTIYYNRALLLMSRPSDQTPFQNVTLQHRALLRLLKTMTQFKPHIQVTREGFRALLSVQLAQKKTKLEQEWGDLKSLAWPPWKEDKSGLDTDRGDIGSESRASRVIRQMVEAGYTKKELEQIATIYAGWDTDNSPTIQSRKFLSIGANRLIRGNGNDVAYTNELWAARISSTRTLREAWLAFLSFEKEVRSHRLKPYTEMAMKILSSPVDGPQSPKIIRAGDGRETLPEPLSPRYITYVPLGPPTLYEFLERTKRNGLKFQGRFLAQLINQAQSFEQALKYLATAHPMLVHGPQPNCRITADEDFLYCIQSLSPPIMTAYLQLLSRLPKEFIYLVNSPSNLGPYFPPRFLVSLRDQLPSARHSLRIVIHYLLFILANYKLTSTSMWNAVLVAFQHIFLYHLRGGNPANPLAADAWSYLDLIQRSIKESNISLGFRGFNELCFICEALFLSGTYSPSTSPDDLQLGSRLFFKSPHPSTIQFKEHFQALVLPLGSTIFKHSGKPLSTNHSPNSQMPDKRPDLLNIPSFHTLHLLIRTLGARRDNTGLRSLLRWMQIYASDLDKGVLETRNGPRLRRLTIVAMRVYVERAWEKDHATKCPTSPEILKDSHSRKALDSANFDPVSRSDAPKLRSKSIVGIVESVGSWGGWPSDEESTSKLWNVGDSINVPDTRQPGII